jgi:hypothetical protein
MDTTVIEAMIAEKCGEPDAAEDIGELLGGAADRQGRTVDQSDLDRGAQLVFRYIELVPYMIKVAWTAASTVGLEVPMGRSLDAVQSYWAEGEDIIPDQLGVIGLLDDAYCSLLSLQMVSDHYQLQAGKYLFPNDLTGANQAIRNLIGEPYASDLDHLVAGNMKDTGLLQAVKALASPEKQLDFSQKSTIWNHGPAGDVDLEDLGRFGLLEEK